MATQAPTAAPGTRTVCPCCCKGVAVSKTGRYSRHGYNGNGPRWANGCPLSGLEVAETPRVMVAALDEALAEALQSAAKAPSYRAGYWMTKIENLAAERSSWAAA